MPDNPSEKRERYSSDYHQLRVNILRTASWLATEIKDFLKPYGITQKQFNILRILRGHKEKLPLTILEIRERMIDKMSDASRIIDRLQKKNFIQKKPCTIDKRATRIEITEQGLAILQQLDQAAADMDAILAPLTQKEAKNANELLNKIRSKSK